MQVKVIEEYDDSRENKRMKVGDILTVSNMRGNELIKAKVAESYIEPAVYAGFTEYKEKEGGRYGKRTRQEENS